MKRLTVVVMTLTAVGAALTAFGSPAFADCARDERPLDVQVATAPIAFVGRVVALDATMTTADFEVEEVWRGGPLPGYLRVHGGTGEPGVVSSVDRTYQPGQRYLVAPYLDGDRLRDNSCTMTRPVDAEVEAARPADAEPASSEPEDEPTSSTPWLLIGVGALAAAAAITSAWVAHHRREPGARSDG